MKEGFQIVWLLLKELLKPIIYVISQTFRTLQLCNCDFVIFYSENKVSSNHKIIDVLFKSYNITF